MITTVYFNTGVKPANRNGLFGIQEWRNGTLQIPMKCEDVPEGAVFLHASSKSEPKYPTHTVCKIVNAGDKGGIVSEFAHFSLPTPDKEVVA